MEFTKLASSFQVPVNISCRNTSHTKLFCFLFKSNNLNLRVKFIYNILEYRHGFGCHCYLNSNFLIKLLFYCEVLKLKVNNN